MADEAQTAAVRRRMAEFALLDAPGHLLRRNHQRSYEIFARTVGDDITRQQVALLIALAQHPGASQNDLVAATGFDRSTMKEMLGRMVARGWVERRRDAADQRAWTIRITPAGQALLDDRFDAIATVQNEILSPLPEDLRPLFLRCLRILIGLEEAEAGERRAG